MDTLELVKAVQRQFGDETGSMIDVHDVLRWINEGQFQIARRTRDLNGSTTIPVLTGTKQYDLPSDFFKVSIAELDGKRLQLLTHAQLSTLYPDLNSSAAQQGVSKFFAVIAGGVAGADILLAPIPGSNGSLIVSYKSRPPSINSTDDTLSIAEEYHNTLLTYCLAKAKQLDGDDQGYATMATVFSNQVMEDAHDGQNKDDETYPYIRTSPGDTQ